MKPNCSVRPMKSRSPLSGLFKAACLGLLPAFGLTQGLLPCPAETQTWTVANTNDTATLASLLQCTSGSFKVEWLGDVVVSQTINVTKGTSLNITGASAGAIADGNHITQRFSVDGAASLHLTDMVLVNGAADFGGAVLALEQATVSFGGNMTFTANTALYGGAIYADASSTVSWGGEGTRFRNNYALYYGGAVMAEGSSSISWQSETVFINNSALYRGGAVYLSDSSEVSWSSNTTFLDSTAWRGGALYASSSTVGWVGNGTSFSNNHALYYGGALMADGSSDVSWDGVTDFIDNSADIVGGALFANDSSNISWSSPTLFTENTASSGGAIYAYSSSSVAWSGQETMFSNNYASSYGGALTADGSSSVSWDGDTVFTQNSADWQGGAIYAYSSSVAWSGEETMFSSNYALYFGGAITADGSSSVSWDGYTIFTQNSADYQGGAIFVRQISSVSWKGDTSFTTNYALYNGGAVMVQALSAVSWDGDTVFTNNTVTIGGGAVYVYNQSHVSWAGNTMFLDNSARDGGGLMMYDSDASWSGTTTFASNTVSFTGGGLNVHTGSRASWTGETTFTGNIANGGGAMYVSDADVSWTGITVFADNIADLDGGAVYTPYGSTLTCRGTTTFRNNTATTGNGGALSIDAASLNASANLNISDDTLFVDNFAFLIGGAIYSSGAAGGQYFEGATFRSNSADIGGAVAVMGNGNANDIMASPTIVLRCRFISNMASSSALAVAGFGPMEINDCFFDGNVLSCEEGLVVEEVLKEDSGTARYEKVCGECPSWNECGNCAVADSNRDPMCSIVPDHTFSDQFGTTLETLRIEKGYWRATNESAVILACYNPDACLGGQTGADTFCNDGYMGPYCSVCRNGYSSSLSTTCTRCSTSRRQWFVAITAIAGIMAVSAIAVFSEYLVSTNFEERKAHCIHRRIFRGVPLQAFKSVVVVWQILTQFASVANVTYPGVYQAFLSGLNIFNLDVGFVMSAGCLWSGVDFHDRLLAGTIWPLAILGLLAITYAIALRRNYGCEASVREKIRHKHVSAVLLLLFLVYSSVSSTVFRMFACDSLEDGEKYLRADYRILCTDEKHRSLQVYAGIMIAVYPVGIPLLFAALLYRHRHVLSEAWGDKTAAQSISSLSAPYKSSCFYYEIVECGRRVMLTGVVVFIYPNDTAQIAITIINSFFFFVVSEVLSPYESMSDTWLSRSGHVLIFFSMFDVLLLRVDVSQESSESQQVLGGVLVAGHVVMIVAVVAEAIGICYAARRERRVMEEPTPSQRALRKPGMSIGQEEAELES